MLKRRLKARYMVSPPKKVQQTYTACEMVGGDMIQTVKTREVVLYMVRLPQGHSIRIGREELVRLGFHLKPRIVDMDSGDVVDLGGDPYDFGKEDDAPHEVVIASDDDDLGEMSYEEITKEEKPGKGATAPK